MGRVVLAFCLLLTSAAFANHGEEDGYVIYPGTHPAVGLKPSALEIVDKALAEVDEPGAGSEIVKKLAEKEIKALRIIKSHLEAPEGHVGILNWFQKEEKLTTGDQSHIHDIVKMLALYVHEMRRLTPNQAEATAAAQEFGGKVLLVRESTKESDLLEALAALNVMVQFRNEYTPGKKETTRLYGTSIQNKRLIMGGITGDEEINGKKPNLDATEKWLRSTSARTLGYEPLLNRILNESH